MRKVSLYDWTLELATEQGALWIFEVLVDAFVSIPQESGNLLDFVSGDGFVDGIFERSAAVTGLLVRLHLINKDYCHRQPQINQ